MKRHTHRLRLELLEERALLSTCHVTRLGDTGNGSGLRGDLRFCIEKINTDGGPGVIDFFKTGTIKLETPLPYLNVEVHIQGPGSDLLTIDGQEKTRVFSISARGDVKLSGMTLKNGWDIDKNGGGGIYNQGALVLENSTVADNLGYDRGGGIYNQGSLIILSSTVSGNFGERSNCCHTWGGGIYNSFEGSLWIVDSRVVGNELEPGFSNVASGGGIANFGFAEIRSTTVSGNTANRIKYGTFGGFGGGVYNEGDLLVEGSLIANNIVSGDYYATGGGISNGGCSDSYCADHYPGGTVRVVNSTIVNNLAYGRGDGFGEAFGGGISSIANGIVTLNHSTIALNRADRFYGYVEVSGGGIGSFGNLQVHNTIIAGNDSVGAGNDLFGTLSSSGYNVFQDASGGSGYSENDALNIDPLLGPLADNGGPTFTMALLPGSRAIDAGSPNPADPPQWDQRGLGYERIEYGTVDIGAFEVQATGAPTVTPRIWDGNEYAVLVTADFESDKALAW